MTASGCLLLHGFSGSPAEMAPLAEALAAEGWVTRTAQLAGHGTSPEDLARVRWPDWVDSARAAYAQLAQSCASVAIVGLSMGGALGLFLAASVQPAAVVAISTPVRVRPLLGRASRMASRVMPYAPILFRLTPRDPAVQHLRSPYRRIPLAATQELSRLLEETRRVLPELRTPLLLVQGRRDWVIPRHSAVELAALARRSAVQVVWLPRSGHVATLDRDRDRLIPVVRTFLRAHLEGGKEAARHGTAD